MSKDTITNLKDELSIIRSIGDRDLEVDPTTLGSRHIKEVIQKLFDCGGMNPDNPDHRTLLLYIVGSYLFRRAGRPREKDDFIVLQTFADVVATIGASSKKDVAIRILQDSKLLKRVVKDSSKKKPSVAAINKSMDRAYDRLMVDHGMLTAYQKSRLPDLLASLKPLRNTRKKSART
jgi:hypothetical protein